MSGEKRDWKREMLAERETLRARVAELETRFFNLERDRDAQRERAERAEKERAEWEQAYNRDLAKERTRREQAERERDRFGAALAEVSETLTCDRKEDPRDAARRIVAASVEANERWRAASQDCTAFRDRCERAEADNAAKNEAFRQYVEWHGVIHDSECPEDDTCDCEFIVALNRAFGPEHPGGALLEELRALRMVREACEPYRGKEAASIRNGSYADAPMFTAQARALVDTCAAADALRGKG